MTRPDHFLGRGGEAFADRVMAAVAKEPTPTPTRAFASAVREGSPRDGAAAVATAWHLGTVRSWRIAPIVRLQAAALVLSVVAVLGTSASLAAAAVVTVIEQVNEQGQTQNDQSGTDEQGPSQNVNEGQTDTDLPGQGENQPGGADGDTRDADGPDDVDQAGPDESGGVDEPDAEQTDADQPGGDQPDADQPGAVDQPDAGGQAGSNESGGADQPDVDQPGSENA